MAAVKRKEVPKSDARSVKKQKVASLEPQRSSKGTSFAGDVAHNGDGGTFKANGTNGRFKRTENPLMRHASSRSDRENTQSTAIADGERSKNFKLETSSAEAHAKQRALAKERRANKPNADLTHRSKKIWERLRRKSHVPVEERKQLVEELFTIINGRVRDLVFKHDSVRVIQCALKYSNQEQRKMIVSELKSDIRTLAESRYGKFLVAKMVQEGDQDVRNTIVPEFYGHVRRLINHPEASWIVDDIYRQIATQQQKATMLREWYGAEFALFHRKPNTKAAAIVIDDDTADLAKILDKSPEKRQPILQYLLQMINSLIQKRMTGFTMLHDAMLQYFQALTPGGEEHAEFLEILKGDIDTESEGGGGDLYRNLAFTKSGSRLVCYALAYGSAKDRKVILRVFKDTIELMAYDQYAKLVLLTSLDVTDDTKVTSRSILAELVGQSIQDESQRLDRLESIVTNINARTPILCPMAGMAKWVLNEGDKNFLEQIHEIRATHSKKDAAARRNELIESMSNALLELAEKRAESLIKSSFGCQFITEALLDGHGTQRSQVGTTIAQLTAGNPLLEGHIANNAAAGRMLKTLVLGGNFDVVSKSTQLADPRLGFGEILHGVIQEHVVDWARSESSFVIVALLESRDVPQSVQASVRASLQKGKQIIEVAAAGGLDSGAGIDGTLKKGAQQKGNIGAKILLEKLVS